MLHLVRGPLARLQYDNRTNIEEYTKLAREIYRKVQNPPIDYGLETGTFRESLSCRGMVDSTAQHRVAFTITPAESPKSMN